MKPLPTVSGGSGPRLIRHTGVAIVVPQSEDDGILVLGALPERSGIAFLIARSDLDAGEVPGNAVGRFAMLGIRAILAPGFERTLYGLCITQGILPVIVGEAALGPVADRAGKTMPLELTVDLERKVVECPGIETIAFEVDARVRNKLLLGLTDLEEMRRYGGDAETLRESDKRRRPWLYGG